MQIEVVRQFGLSRFVYFADPERQQPLYYWAEPREAVNASPLDRDVVHLPLARHGTAAGRAINPNTIRVRTFEGVRMSDYWPGTPECGRGSGRARASYGMQTCPINSFARCLSPFPFPLPF